MARVAMNETMEATLCLAAKKTPETILVCSKGAGHEGEHFDSISCVGWTQEKQPIENQEAA